MDPKDTQDLVELALERAIESMDVIATEPTLDRYLRETQDLCNAALVELRGYGFEKPKEEWQYDSQDEQ